MDNELRKLQLMEFEMLKDVAEFCDANDITYFLNSGTLLGAIRHNGFIPWDDDIDICMDSVNYNKFRKFASKELDPKYFFQNYSTDPKVGIRWSRIRINGTTSMERELRNFDIHHGICMDIFEMNGVAKNRLRRLIQKVSDDLMSNLLVKHYTKVKNINVTSKWKFVYRVVPEKIRIMLIKILEKLTAVDLHKTTYCYNNYYGFSNEKSIFPSQMFMKINSKKVLFENEYFNAPIESIKYLEIEYGDWKTLPPVEQRSGHVDIIVDVDNDYKKYQELYINKKFI